jgi:hypothetical protein
MRVWAFDEIATNLTIELLVLLSVQCPIWQARQVDYPLRVAFVEQRFPVAVSIGQFENAKRSFWPQRINVVEGLFLFVNLMTTNKILEKVESFSCLDAILESRRPAISPISRKGSLPGQPAAGR